MSEDSPEPDDRREAEGEDQDRDPDPEETVDDADPDLFTDAVTDRRGDPFEGLGTPADTADAADGHGDDPHEQPSEATQSGDGAATDEAGAWQSLSEMSAAGEPHEAGEDDTTPDGPEERPPIEPGEGGEDLFDSPDPRGDPFEEDVFEERETGDIDPDEAWADLATTEEHGGDETERRYAEVSKHSYCENCEWFSDPPETSCTHEGTEIVEFLDMETVRLLNCPVVEERRAIRNED
jgi:hypothetical protein